MSRDPTRRRVLAGLAAGGTLGLGGCVTLSPSLSAATDGSDVFKSVSTSEPWAAQRVRASVSLADGATTDANVRRLVVVGPGGSTYVTVTVESGQTSATVYFPLGGTSTLAAVDNSGKTVDTIEVTV